MQANPEFNTEKDYGSFCEDFEGKLKRIESFSEETPQSEQNPGGSVRQEFQQGHQKGAHIWPSLTLISVDILEYGLLN